MAVSKLFSLGFKLIFLPCFVMLALQPYFAIRLWQSGTLEGICRLAEEKRTAPSWLLPVSVSIAQLHYFTLAAAAAKSSLRFF